MESEDLLPKLAVQGELTSGKAAQPLGSEDKRSLNVSFIKCGSWTIRKSRLTIRGTANF
jgi:hypothetical protein